MSSALGLHAEHAFPCEFRASGKKDPKGSYSGASGFRNVPASNSSNARRNSSWVFITIGL
jgi:hypothetical protein